MTAVIPDVTLSPYAVSLLRVLTVPEAAEDDPIAREPVDTSRLSDRELAVLLPVAFRLSAQHPAHRVVGAIVTAGQLRQPAFTPEPCAAMLSVAVEKLERGGYGGYAVLAVNALARCEGPLPEEAARSAGKLVTLLGDRYRLDHPYALMALAGLGGGLTARIESKLFAWSLHSIARDEAAVVSALGPTAQALLAEASGERSYHSPPPLPDLWQRLADLPGYASFAHRALEAAHRRVADIQSGRIAYKADAAFERDEVGALGRAVRVALLRDEPWLMDLLRPLLLGVAVAPTAARTAPSQALLHEGARAIEDFPTPEALAAARAAQGHTQTARPRAAANRNCPGGSARRGVPTTRPRIRVRWRPDCDRRRV